MNIEVEKFTVENLLKRNSKKSLLGEKKIFSIPRFQRVYSWQEIHWNNFIEDVLRSWNKVDLNSDFWGALLLCKKENCYEVVDGQQRIITLLLLQLSLGAQIEENGKLPLLFSDEKQNGIFVNLVDKKKLSSDQKRSNMVKAKQYFDDMLKGKDRQSILNFLSQTVVSVIIVDDEVESNLLFGRLNTRGLELNQIDLIKYWIFSQVEKDAGKQNEDVALQRWHTLQKECSSINLTIEKFISVWWKANYGLLKSNELFESFKKTITDDYIGFLDRVLSTVNKINELKNNNDGNDNGIGRNLKWFLKFADENALVVIVSIVDTTFSKKSKQRLVEILTVYEFIRSLFVHNINYLNLDFDFEVVNIAYINFSKSLSQSLNERNIMQAVDTLKGTLFTNLPNPDDFQLLFTNLRYIDSSVDIYKLEKMLSCYAVYTLANWLDDLTRGAGKLLERTRDDDEYSIEHIVPKSTAFNENSNEYKIGNLMVLERTINNALGDIPVKEKLSSYRKSSYPQVKQFLYKTLRRNSKWGGANTWKAADFDEQDIILRGEALAQEFYENTIRILK